MIQFLREYDDFTFFAEAVARDLASQNIRYTEAFYSPPDFMRRGLQLPRLTEAIRTGLARVPEIEIALIADVVRDLGPENAAVTLAQLKEVRELGVIGIGLGGSEQCFPPEPFEDVYAEADGWVSMSPRMPGNPPGRKASGPPSVLCRWNGLATARGPMRMKRCWLIWQRRSCCWNCARSRTYAPGGAVHR